MRLKLAAAALFIVTAFFTKTPVTAETTDPVLRPWRCLASSVAATPVFVPVVTADCPAAPTTWPEPARGVRAAATVLVPPGAPSGLTVNVTGTTVALSWNAPTSGGAPSSYVIQAGSATGLADRANANTGSTSVALTATNVPSATYYVRVLAQNRAGTSPASNEIVFAVLSSCATAPSAPTGLVASTGGSAVTLSWQPPTVGCAPTAYGIQAGTAPGLSNLANFSTGSNAPTFTATTVGAGTYYVRVVAITQGGASGPSNEIQLVVGACTRAPDAPSGLTALVSGLTVTLSWTAPSTQPATYTLDVGSSPGRADLGVINTASATSLTATDVPAGTYYVQAKATNACGTSPASNGVTVVVTIPSGTFTLLYSFSGPDGQGPNGPLVQGLDGNFYGTTSLGGSLLIGGLRLGGTAFRMTPAGGLTVLHNFAGGPSDGRSVGALIQGSDGNFYGSTLFGGPADAGTLAGFSGYGTVFQMTPQGTVTPIHFFDSTTRGGSGPLLQASDGNFYGTNGEVVFRMTPSGTLTVLHVFSGRSPDGTLPSKDGLIQATDGNLYGTSGDYATNGGTYFIVFKTALDGTFSVPHSFPGYGSANGLTQGADGNFYGTTTPGRTGFGPSGTVFKLTPDGQLTVLHAFNDRDGYYPLSRLVQARNGNFYGTTSGAPQLNIPGTLFMITPGGAFSVLHYFSGSAIDGAQPGTALIQGSDGNLYGTTWMGGASNLGTVFRITP